MEETAWLSDEYLCVTRGTVTEEIALMAIGWLDTGTGEFASSDMSAKTASPPAVCTRVTTVDRQSPPASFFGEAKMRELVRPPTLPYEQMHMIWEQGLVLVGGIMTTNARVCWDNSVWMKEGLVVAGKYYGVGDAGGYYWYEVRA